MFYQPLLNEGYSIRAFLISNCFIKIGVLFQQYPLSKLLELKYRTSNIYFYGAKMPRSYVKKLKRWNNDDIKMAIEEVKCGKSIRKATSKHNMSEGKLCQAIKKNEKGIDLSCQSGKKTSLSSEVEKTLPNVIGVLCKIGFSPSKDEVLDLVSKYFKENNIKAAKFKDGRPGPDWLKLCMKRNKLSFKKANMIVLLVNRHHQIHS